MILIDSSAWIEYLRDTGSAACQRVDELLATDASIATCDTVLMEIPASARPPNSCGCSTGAGSIRLDPSSTRQEAHMCIERAAVPGLHLGPSTTA